MTDIMRKGSLLLTGAIFFCSLLTRAQVQPYDSLLNILDTRYPQEKIYLHFDKSYYNPGETIWFKAYLFSGNIPSQISKTLYAELIDEKGKVLERKVAPVVVSGAAAAFDLPADLRSPTVYVRAYTDWMLNFDSSLLYQRAIPVVQTAGAAAAAVTPKYFLQFFPESGDLVEGVESRVAFKATDIKGLPFNIDGKVLDSKGKEVTAFTNMHDGMGYFVLTPDAKEKYRAVWKDGAGKQQQTDLPAAKKDGFVLRTDQDATGIHFTISRPGPEEAPNASVYLVGQMQQQMVYMATANLSKSKTIKGNIPVESLPAGIVQLTVFSQQHQPLAERIVFVNQPDYYFITDLNAALKSVEKRRKNVIQIDVPDTIATNLSVSVTDADVNPRQAGEEDIFSQVLLTSDIKGYVHNPGYYFSSDVDSVLKHRDLVMMTHGWRRFVWKEVLAGKFPSIKRMPSEYITINGRITGLTRSQLTQKELTGILEIDKKQQFINIPVDPSGAFTVPGLIFFDTARLFYQFNNDKDKFLTSTASFDIKNNFSNGYASVKPDTSLLHYALLPDKITLGRNSDLSKKYAEVQEARRKIQTLETVTVTARQKSKQQLMDEEYTSGLFSGGDGYTFIMDDDISARSAMSVLSYLQGRVAGLQISGSGSQMSMSWRGGSPTLFLNEVQSDVNMIQSLSMNDVAMIKVFRPPFFGAPGGGSGGGIAVYTKKGAAMNSDQVKGLDFASIPGYSAVKEFYSPDYSKYDERHSEGDFRSTLYWNPFILTGKDNRRLFFTFYNNDVTKRFRVVVEGCDVEGKLTRIEKVFE